MDALSCQLHQMLEEAVANGEVAGANLLVLRGGSELVYTQAGFADVENRRPYSRDTIARLYSMSKPVTAAAAMMLVERGQLDLGNALGDYIPAFRDMKVWENGQKVPARRNILVKDLLSMTSGLPYPGEDNAGREAGAVFDESGEVTTMEFVEKLAGCALTFHPGDRWMYGTSADVLGAVVEKVSGMRFGEFLKKELFVPLGMNDTGFYVAPEKYHRLAQVYEKAGQGMRLFKTDNLRINYAQDASPAFESGGAGLVSCIDDYAKFAQMLMNGGRLGDVRILQPGTVAYMTQPSLSPWQQESLWQSWESMGGYGYGNLMRIMKDPGMAVLNGWKGEYGWDGWLGCYFCNSPENEVTILLTCQLRDAGTTTLTRQIRNVLAACL